jgi:hypothetical protein
MTDANVPDKGETSDRLRKLGIELRQLRETIKAGGVDPLAMRDFQGAIDNLRLSAWTLQLWLEEQAQGRDPLPLRRQLGVERIRRATELNRNLVEDLDASEVDLEVAELKGLFHSVEALSGRLHHLFRESDSGA